MKKNPIDENLYDSSHNTIMFHCYQILQKRFKDVSFLSTFTKKCFKVQYLNKKQLMQ